MRRQSADHDCGPTAIANALEFHHRRLGLRGLRALCGASESSGTDEHGIVRALLAYRCGVDEHSADVPLVALAWVRASLESGRPVILCVDRWEHWVTVIGWAGRQAIIYDPARETGGAAALREKDLRRRWEAAKRTRGRAPRFYGVAVGPPEV